LLLVVNAGIVGTVRMKWETIATQTLRRQLTDLAKPGTQIVINFPSFDDSGEGRLKAWGIHYQKVTRAQVRAAHGARELMSMVEGYPGPVDYRVLPMDPVPQPNR
jgi:hypothetical protein